MIDPVPPSARTELTRLAARWHQLPLGQALPHVGAVLELAQRYADRAAEYAGLPPTPLPDIGPAVVMDQLTVTVYDLCRREPADLERELTELQALRRRLP